MQPRLLEVLADGALELPVCGVLRHLLLPFHEPVLSVVDLSQVMQEQFLRVGDRHVYLLCLTRLQIQTHPHSSF
jgi:hypothetical protein